MKFSNIFLLLVGLVFVSVNAQDEDMGMDMDMDHNQMQMQMQMQMQHGNVEASEEMSVEVEVTEDPVDGFNVHIIPTGLEFTPEKVNSEHVEGEGHAHLYLNDEKIARVYSPWFHISTSLLNEDDNELRVTLNSNDHNYYAYDGEVVAATTTLSLAAVEGTEENASKSESSTSLLINLTTDDTWAAGMALGFASRVLEQGYSVTIFLNVSGVHIASTVISHDTHSMAEQTPHDTLAGLIENGATVIVCPVCQEKAGIADEDLLEGTTKGSPDVTIPLIIDPNIKILSY